MSKKVTLNCLKLVFELKLNLVCRLIMCRYADFRCADCKMMCGCADFRCADGEIFNHHSKKIKTYCLATCWLRKLFIQIMAHLEVKRKRRNWWLWLIIIIIVIAVVAFCYQRYYPSATTVTTTDTIKTTITHDSTATPKAK
jgi:hypothetical protein